MVSLDSTWAIDDHIVVSTTDDTEYWFRISDLEYLDSKIGVVIDKTHYGKTLSPEEVPDVVVEEALYISGRDFRYNQ